MKAFFQKLEPGPERSFLAFRSSSPQFEVPWHFHPEYELTYIVKSSGNRLVGDSIKSFQPGDLALLGPNLPHCWLNLKEDSENPGHESEAVVIQFRKDFMGPNFFQKPEMKKIHELLEKSQNGLSYQGKTQEQIGNTMLDFPQKSPLEQFIGLIEILKKLAESKEYESLSSDGFTAQLAQTESEKINLVLNHLKKNFKNKIKLEEVAALTHMAPAAFCRFFKARTSKTFVHFVNEFKIGYASRLLIETDLPVSQIATEAGFHNIANFNRHFSKFKDTTPTRYRKQVRLMK